MEISLFITCLNDTFFPETGKAMVHLLDRLGHNVKFPLEQTCCGQMHYNSGYQEEVVPLVYKFVELFNTSEVVVAPSASCVGMINENYSRIARMTGDDELIENVSKLIPRVYELSEFLVHKLGIVDVGAYYPHRVTWHPTCHSIRMIESVDCSLDLLKHVKGIELTELPDSDVCCGFGGTFAVKNADTSMAMLSDKVSNIKRTNSEICSASDNSCLMHIGGALKRQRSGIKTVHLAEILASTEN